MKKGMAYLRETMERLYYLEVFMNEQSLGSGLIDHSQKMTVAAMAMADMKVWAHRS